MYDDLIANASAMSEQKFNPRKGHDFTGVCCVFFCHDGKGNFIMAQRSDKCRDNHGAWDFGGGGLKFRESLESCVNREVLEEYGTKPLHLTLLGHREIVRQDGGHWIAFDWKVLVDRESVRINDPDMIDDLQWFRMPVVIDTVTFMGCLPMLVHDQLEVFVEKYLPYLFVLTPDEVRASLNGNADIHVTVKNGIVTAVS